MKAITIDQPWASMIPDGPKRMETRSWPTKYQGPILIHASMRRPEPGCLSGIPASHLALLPRGQIVAKAWIMKCLPIDDRIRKIAKSRHKKIVIPDAGHVVTVTEFQCGNFVFDGYFAFILGDVFAVADHVAPLIVSGKQRFWECEVLADGRKVSELPADTWKQV